MRRSQSGNLPPGDWRLPSTRSILGGSLSRQNKFAEAEPLLLAGYQGLRQAKDAPAKRVAEALDRIVSLYEKWGKPELAKKWRGKRSKPV